MLSFPVQRVRCTPDVPRVRLTQRLGESVQSVCLMNPIQAACVTAGAPAVCVELRVKTILHNTDKQAYYKNNTLH